jgi:hypothetical protein
MIAMHYLANNPGAKPKTAYATAQLHFKEVVDVLWAEYQSREHKTDFMKRMRHELEAHVLARDSLEAVVKEEE